MELIPKFRAWDKEGHRMILPKYLHSIDLLEEQVTERTKCNYTFSLHSIPFDRAKLMQSTGIFDKNDTEIFEGDALKNNDYPNQTFICKHSRLQASFQAESLNGLLTLSLWKDEERDWQVLGNIYENPELVEADNDTK